MEAPAPRVTDAMQLADIAIANASPAMAHPRLQRLLMKWGNDRDAQRLLAELVRCYTAERLSSDKFRQSELSYLREIASTYPRLRVPVDQVGAAYVGNLPPRPREAGRAFTEWRYDGWQQDAMASLLTMVGDLYASNDNYGFALTRYGAAWDIAHEPKYALEFASLVQKKPELDPQGSLINDLLDSMFMEKGGYYMKKDWPNILRMHVAIGTIFEDRRQWGSAGEPRSAIFQWEHALIADQEVRRTQLGMPPSPGVNLHLANCYAAVGRASAATQQYLTAAEGYLKAGDPIEASTAAGFARKVGGAQLSPEDMRRLKGAEETIDRMMTSRKR